MNRRSTQLLCTYTPSHWDHVDTEICLIGIEEKCTEHRKIEKKFRKGQLASSCIKIQCIYRIQNKPLFEEFSLYKKTLLRQHIKNLNILQLFHGTSPEVAHQILAEGFDWRVHGKNGTSYGKGSYFSSSSVVSGKYSKNDANGTKLMFLAKVITGIPCLGTPDMLREPAGFHSTVNDLTNPSVYVVYHTKQVYPEYLISFTDQPNCTIQNITLGYHKYICSVDAMQKNAVKCFCGSINLIFCAVCVISQYFDSVPSTISFVDWAAQKECEILEIEASNKALGLRAGGLVTVTWKSVSAATSQIGLYLCKLKSTVLQTLTAATSSQSGSFCTGIRCDLPAGKNDSYFVAAVALDSCQVLAHSDLFTVKSSMEVSISPIICSIDKKKRIPMRVWQNQLNCGDVVIDLYKGGCFFQNLGLIQNFDQAEISFALQLNWPFSDGSDYTLKVTSKTDPDVFGMSHTFSFPNNFESGCDDNWRQNLQIGDVVDVANTKSDWQYSKADASKFELAHTFSVPNLDNVESVCADKERENLQIGASLEAANTNNIWHESVIVSITGGVAEMRLKGCASDYHFFADIRSEFVQPVFSKTFNWRNFSLGDEVEVQISDVNFRWYFGKVLEVDKIAQKIKVEASGIIKWLDIDSEEICRVGTHRVGHADRLIPREEKLEAEESWPSKPKKFKTEPANFDGPASVYFDIEIGGNRVGRIVIELFEHLSHTICKRFRDQCKMDAIAPFNAQQIQFKGSLKIQKVWKDQMLEVGDDVEVPPGFPSDLENSIFGKVLKHDKPFLVSMPHFDQMYNRLKFCITFGEVPELDRSHFVFGQVIEGEPVCEMIENTPTNLTGQPIHDVVIVHCGEIPF